MLASVVRSWCSQKLMVCGAPSSVTAKSLAVSPRTGLPCFIFDDHGLDHQLRLHGEREALLAGSFVLADLLRARRNSHKKRDDEMKERFAWLEPEPDGSLQRAHSVCRRRPPKLLGVGLAGAVPHRIPIGELRMVEHVVCSHCEVKIGLAVRAKVRASELLSENWLGPVIESRPAVPHCPAAGAVISRSVQMRDSHLMCRSFAPVRLGRMTPVFAVPGTARG